MIEFKDISLRYGTQTVLDGVSFRIHAGERVGIVGPNGAGKSSLFHLIIGARQSDGGVVTLEGNPAIGYVRQHLEPEDDAETLLEYALRGVPRLHDMEVELHRLAAAVDAAADEAERGRLLRRLGEMQSQFEHLGGYQLETRVKAALGGLGFKVPEFDRPFITFSGGWRMRAELARILASVPGLLLLDEPSNYLDLPAIEWLQRFLRSYEGTLLLISHDRYLLRSLASVTIEVDAGSCTRYPGDLDYYLREREARYVNLLAAKANQDRRREQLERFVERFKATSSKASQAQSRVKQLEKLEEIRLPKRSQSAGYLRIAPAPHCGAEVVRMEGVSFSYDGVHKVLDGVDLAISRGDKVAIIGYNGMGKTTLLRLIAGVRQPDTGRVLVGHKVLPGYQSQEFAETIPPEVSVLEVAKRAAPASTERDLRSRLGSFGFSADDVGKPCGVLSGGEKIRLAFLRLFLNPPNFLLLDEPTTHLDLDGRRTLEQALGTYDGTVCLVSHDVAFVRAVATSVIEISPAGVRRFPGGYDYYREKTAGETRQTANETASDVAASGGLSSKDLRRVRAQERAKRAPQIRDLRRRVEQSEAKMAALEVEQKTLSDQLTAATPGTDFADISRRLRGVQHSLHLAALDWEEPATQLDALEKEQAEAQDAIT
ncbi:MAG: ABC-F family ATP-binding cassette domain-containing protein [Lentisphaerota bacterium]